MVRFGSLIWPSLAVTSPNCPFAVTSLDKLWSLSHLLSCRLHASTWPVALDGHFLNGVLLLLTYKLFPSYRRMIVEPSGEGGGGWG